MWVSTAIFGRNWKSHNTIIVIKIACISLTFKLTSPMVIVSTRVLGLVYTPAIILLPVLSSFYISEEIWQFCWSRRRCVYSGIGEFAASVQSCRNYQVLFFRKNRVLKFGRGCEITELQQNWNLINRILKANSGIKTHFVGKILSLYIKGKL